MTVVTSPLWVVSSGTGPKEDWEDDQTVRHRQQDGSQLAQLLIDLWQIEHKLGGVGEIFSPHPEKPSALTCFSYSLSSTVVGGLEDWFSGLIN